MSHFLLCGVSMTALSHIQHAQLSAFSFISEGGRVSQREIASWCWDFTSDYTPSCGSHGEEKQKLVPPFRCMHVHNIMNVAAITEMI